MTDAPPHLESLSSRSDEQAAPRWPFWKRGLMILAIWSVPVGATVISTLMQFRETDGGLSLWMMILRSSFFWFIYALLTPLVLWANRLVPMGGPRRAGRFVLHVIMSVLFALLAGILTMGAALVLDDQEFSLEATLSRLLRSGEILIWSDMIYWIVLAAAVSIDNARAARIQRSRAARLQRQLTEARLNALRAQLHPHFLFNTLNGIASLVRQARTEPALEMIGHLSALLRASLRRDASPMIPLSDELELLEQYLAIELARFGDRLEVRYDIDPEAMEVVIPPLLLQPLVENAVQHGIAPDPAGGALGIRAHVMGDQLEVIIENDGAALEAEPAADSDGVGLPNTRERLRVAYGDAASLTLTPRATGGATQRIRIPILPGDGGSPT